MDFINRDDEMRRLGHLLQSGDAALAILWGRRRIGKTRLLLEWTRKNDGVYWVADASAASIQRHHLAAALAQKFPGFDDVEYPDWDTLLRRLMREIKTQNVWRGPLVIDELPYVIAAAPEFASVLQRYIDHEAKDCGLILALSGSSQQMMRSAVLTQDAPLYGRAQALMQLEPLAFGYIGKALQLTDARAAVEAYAAWGGVPRYWELARGFGDDVAAAFENNVLDPLGALFDEPQRLLLEEIPQATSLRPIMDAIGLGAHRVSEIAAKIGQPAPSLSRPLKRLQELGFIRREVPFGDTEFDGKRALYHLGDPFLKLWFETVAPHRSLLQQSPRKTRLAVFNKIFPKHVSNTWEHICRAAVPHLQEQLGGIEFGPAGRYWHGQGPEWDVVALSLDKKHLLLGEVKWSEKAATQKYLQAVLAELHAKGVPPIRRAADVKIHRVVFVPELAKAMTGDEGHFCVNADEVVVASNSR